MKITQPAQGSTFAQNAASAPASGVTVVDAGGFYTGTDLETILAEIPITAKDEGVNLTTNLDSLDFVGAGVTATNIAGAVTITIPGTSTASAVAIVDAGGWFTGTDVEAALQELASKAIGYQAHGAMGAAETFSALVGWHSGTFDANCTFTLTGAPAGPVSSLFLELAQDGTGGWTLTLPASVVNRVALEAAQDTTASTTSFLVLLSRDNGTTWYGGWWGGGVSFATPAIVHGTAAAAGVATTAIRSDATLVTFDATVPSTQAFGDAAATGSVALAARRDHKHAMPANPVTEAAVQAVGHYELLMAAGSSPIEPLETGDGLDWLYVWVTP